MSIAALRRQTGIDDGSLALLYEISRVSSRMVLHPDPRLHRRQRLLVAFGLRVQDSLEDTATSSPVTITAVAGVSTKLEHSMAFDHLKPTLQSRRCMDRLPFHHARTSRFRGRGRWL